MEKETKETLMLGLLFFLVVGSFLVGMFLWMKGQSNAVESLFKILK